AKLYVAESGSPQFSAHWLRTGIIRTSALTRWELNSGESNVFAGKTMVRLYPLECKRDEFGVRQTAVQASAAAAGAGRLAARASNAAAFITLEMWTEPSRS